MHNRGMSEHKIFSMAVADVYPHYVAKVERKKRTEQELHEVIEWLTGYDSEQLDKALEDKLSFREFFDQAPNMNDNRKLITGKICGVSVQDIEDPLMQEIRYLDKVVDELATGKALEKIKRTPKD